MPRQTQGGLGADAALPIEDSGNTTRGDTQRQRQPVGGHAAGRQFALENPTGMNGRTEAKTSELQSIMRISYPVHRLKPTRQLSISNTIMSFTNTKKKKP